MSENIDLTDVTDCKICSVYKNVPLRNVLTYKNVG